MPPRPEQWIVDPPGQRHRVRTPRECRRLERIALVGNLFATRLGCYERVLGHGVRRKGGFDPLVLLCLEGEGWLEIGGRRLRLRAREAAWIDCRQPHAYGSDASRPWSIAWAHLAGRDLHHWRRQLIANRESATWRPANPEAAQAAFEILWHETELGQDLQASLACAAWLGSLMAGTVRGAAAPPHDAIDAAAERLRTRSAEAVSLRALARSAGLSPGHFLARFRSRWGCPPRHYQIRQRLQRACTLLETTPAKVSAIAADVGYDNPFYFSRLFQLSFGESPTAYRARCGKAPRAL